MKKITFLLILCFAIPVFAEEKTEPDWKAKYEQLANDYVKLSNELTIIKEAHARINGRLVLYQNQELKQKTKSVITDIVRLANDKKIKELKGNEEKPSVDNSDPTAIQRN